MNRVEAGGGSIVELVQCIGMSHGDLPDESQGVCL